MLPIIQALKAAGNRVISILAGRSKDLIILENEVRKTSDEVIIMTDDGSYGQKGLVTQGIENVIKREKVNKVFAIGPAIMMKFCCLLTKKYGISTDVSLNTIMVDGTGMCGACRITVGGKTRFVCVDGPEFDGHEVDFDEMLKRLGAFKPIEIEEMKAYENHLNATTSTNSEQTKTDSLSTINPITGKEMDMEEPISELTDRNSEWRQSLRKSLKAKERTALKRVCHARIRSRI
jgi:glutamate synthase (NADPH/NADH) small chain